LIDYKEQVQRKRKMKKEWKWEKREPTILRHDKWNATLD
jgi:hypothetical protein